MDTLKILITQTQKTPSIENFRRLAEQLSGDSVNKLTPLEQMEVAPALKLLLYESAKQNVHEDFSKIGERYLYRTDMPFVSARALALLCSYNHPTERYAKIIKQAMKGLDWDEDRELESAALVYSVDLYQTTRDNEIVCILIQTLQHGTTSQMRQHYETLLQIVDKPNPWSFDDWLETEPQELVDWSLVSCLEREFGCSK